MVEERVKNRLFIVWREKRNEKELENPNMLRVTSTIDEINYEFIMCSLVEGINAKIF